MQSQQLLREENKDPAPHKDSSGDKKNKSKYKMEQKNGKRREVRGGKKAVPVTPFRTAM